MHDVEEIAALLHIHEKAMAQGLALSNIRDMAWNRLKKLNADHAAPPTVPAPAPTPKAQDQADDEIDAEARSPSLAKALQEKMKGTHHG